MRVVKGDERPLPRPLKWLAVGMNVLLLFTEGVLLSARGVAMANPNEVVVVILAVTTPIVSLAVFLDYNRRGV
jgi:hypothetical protein